MMYKLKSFYRYHLRGNLLYHRANKILSSSKTPVVIYTMAKVGSLSLFHSLKNSIKDPVFHVHTLVKENIDWELKACRDRGWWPDSKNTGPLIYSQRILKNKPVNLITAVREPVERNISAFFEAFRFYNQCNPNEFKGSLKDLTDNFLRLLPHDYTLNWLTKEVKKCLNIDVFQHDFNNQKKFQTYCSDNNKLLLMRLDLQDNRKELCIQNYLGISDFVLQNHNIAEKKKYADLYQMFKDKLVLPESYVVRMLDSQYCQHFYSEQEVKAFYRKWTRQ